jgi:hypothetical protein
MSSDDDEAIHPPEPDAPVDRKVSATDDTGDAGTISAKALVPGPIGAGAPGNPRPPATDRVPTVPPASGRRQKCLHIVVK